MSRPGAAVRGVVRCVFWASVVLIPIAATALASAWAGGPTHP